MVYSLIKHTAKGLKGSTYLISIQPRWEPSKNSLYPYSNSSNTPEIRQEKKLPEKNCRKKIAGKKLPEKIAGKIRVVLGRFKKVIKKITTNYHKTKLKPERT